MNSVMELRTTGSVQIPRTDNPIILGIGPRIKEARENAKLTQAKLAELADVSRTAVTQWEASMTFPNFEKTLELAKLLKVRPEWIGFGVNTPVEYRTLELDAVKVPLITFGKEVDERTIVETHFLDKARLAAKSINGADDGKVFFWKIESEAFAARYAPGSLLLIDSHIDWINGEGDYLIWNGAAQVVNAENDFIDNTKVLLTGSVGGAAREVDASKVKVLGRVKGVFN